MTLDLDRIRAAARLIAGAVVRTPCLKAAPLSRLIGAEIWVKFENLQFTSSFKDRGALVLLSSLSDAERRTGVIAMSAGNHAQGVAYHAQRLGIPATVVMPVGTPNVKIQRTRGFGAGDIGDGDQADDPHGFDSVRRYNVDVIADPKILVVRELFH